MELPDEGERIVKKARSQSVGQRRSGYRADAVAGSSAVGGAIPESDPAFPILSGVLRVVPVSRWNFARVDAGGNLVSRFGSHGNAHDLVGLAAEYDRQSAKVHAGPRISATLGPLDEFASGVTLLFGDARADFAILTLLRSADLGPFTSSEISVLTFALDALSDRLSELRLQPHGKPIGAPPLKLKAAAPEQEEAFYVLDRDLQIVLAWSSGNQRRIALTPLHTRIAERLPAVLEDTVREMTTAWTDQSAPSASISLPVPFLLVRTQPMSGPSGLFVGVRIERSVTPNSLTGAASRFRISPREVQVLALLLDGNHLDDIGKQLHITSSTVQNHIKSMLDKTGSTNRSELIARILGWESARIATPIDEGKRARLRPSQ